MSSEALSFSRQVNTTPDNAYRAFTNATDLRDWLCNVATVVPRPGGRFYLWWESGYYTVGEYTAADPGKKVSFTWFGRGEPAPTQVEVTFAAQDGGTLVSLDHSGVGSGELWSPVIEEMEKGWTNALENLASICETGEDLRFVTRPMLGIILDEFNEQIAKKLGVPVSEGIRLSGTVEGMGAEAAGLKNDDVLVSMGGLPTIDFDSLNNALNIHKAGDTIEVEFYRGSDKESVMMTLSGRPIPEIPPTPKELAEAVEVIYNDIETKLDAFLDGISEEEASFNPNESGWSVKRNLGHFIQGERSYQQYIADMVSGYERYADDWGGNVNELLDATIAIYPTVPEMVAEYKRNMAETLHLLANLPEEFVAHKGSYWRLAYNSLQDPFHFDGHLEQMQESLDAARNN
jgi:uncharacterized protein YndB with AHSA1/START domain